jgi:predicted N-acetyltransferase YhbS
MAPDVLIRTATPGDLPQVRALLVSTWHDTYDSLLGADRVTEITNAWHSMENLARQLGLARSSFLVAENGGVIVGHAFAQEQSPDLLILGRLYVLPAHQRRGIGRCLLAEAVARHPGAGVLRLKVEAGNAKGLSFYRREGFVEKGQEILEDIDHLLMEKRLSR